MAPSVRSAATVTAAAYLISLLTVSGPLGVMFGIVTHLLFAGPGVLIVRGAAGVSAGWLVPLAFGPLVGQALGSVALTALWAAGGRGIWLLAAAPALVALLVLPARRLEGRWTVPAAEAGEWAALALLLLLVPLVVGWPFAHVGATIDGHQAYRAYFTADYVWRRAVVVELAKGDFLPANPYYLDDALHYYWLPHLMSAVMYRATRAWLSLDALLITGTVLVDACFVAFLYGVVRMFRVRPWAAAAGVATAVLCSSFEGTYAVAVYLRDGVSLRELRNLNIDAISRWFLQAMPIDGLQRLLLYQPHHAVGYAMGLLGLLAFSHRARRSDPLAVAVAGTLLGLATLISSFAGLMVTAAAVVVEGVSAVRDRDWRQALMHATAAGLPLAVSAGLVLALGYVEQGSSVIMLGLNDTATHHVVTATLVSMGPMIALGGAGAILAWRLRRSDFLVLAALALVSIGFYFFTDIKDHQHVYVGWRVGHFLFMGGAVTVGLLIEHMAGLPPRARLTARLAFGVVALGALPTTLIDIYNTQDIWNWNEGPGFRWTLLLTPEDQQLFRWLQQNTPPEAIVQVDPVIRDSSTWAYLPAFAERRMSMGLPISMVPLAKYQEGAEVMHRMYDADARAAYDTAVRHRINYLVVGPPEREAHQGVEKRFDSIPAQMPLVLRNATISVYKILPEL